MFRYMLDALNDALIDYLKMRTASNHSSSYLQRIPCFESWFERYLQWCFILEIQITSPKIKHRCILEKCHKIFHKHFEFLTFKRMNYHGDNGE